MMVSVFTNGQGKTWVQSQVQSYQRLKKWYLILPCLTLSSISYWSRIKWSNPKKGVAPSPTLWCSSYRKGSLRVILNYGHQLYLLPYKTSQSSLMLLTQNPSYRMGYHLVIIPYFRQFRPKASSDPRCMFLKCWNNSISCSLIILEFSCIWKLWLYYHFDSFSSWDEPSWLKL